MDTIFPQPIRTFCTHYVKLVHNYMLNQFSYVQKQYFKGYNSPVLFMFINPSSPYDVKVSHQHKFIATEMFQSNRPVFGHIFVCIVTGTGVNR